jgi:cytochrome c553
VSASVRFAALLAAVITVTPGFTRPLVLAQADKAAVMRGHYAQVLAMHAAVIRGDIAGIAAPARELVRQLGVPTNPPAPQATLDEMRFAARWAADTSNLAVAAAATASLLKGCGDCHRAGSVRPVADLPGKTKVGGVVGTMLDHQRAAEQMLQGLIGPSSAAWQEGARTFATAPLHPKSLPVNSAERKEMVRVEERLQRDAAKAADLEDSYARAAAYASILAECSGCHAKHAKIWGPVR